MSEARSKVLEGLRALRAGKIGLALDAWEAALAMDPACTQAEAFRDYVKKNRIRMAVHIGRQTPAQGEPLEFPSSWPTPPAGLCEPPDDSPSESIPEADVELPSLVPAPEASPEAEADYDAVELAQVEDLETPESKSEDAEAGALPVLEIVLDEEPEGDAGGGPELLLEGPLEVHADGFEETAPYSEDSSEEPVSTFAEDAPTITRDPTQIPARAPSKRSAKAPAAARPPSKSRKRSGPARSPAPGMPTDASPRGTLMGVGITNPFAGGMQATFGPATKPARKHAHGMPGDGAFSEDQPTHALSPEEVASHASGARGAGDYDQSESSFRDDQPTQARDLPRGMSPTPRSKSRKAKAEPSFAEDQETIARLEPTSSSDEPEAAEESEDRDDPKRDLNMARLLYDEGAFEPCGELLDRMQDKYGDLPGMAELREQNQAALEAAIAEKLGPTTALVVPRSPTGRLSDLALDPRAAFLLSLIDGTLSIDDVIDISGMSRRETSAILLKLRELDLLVFEPSR